MRNKLACGVVATTVLAFGASPAAGHNSGCVETGNGGWVSVGSGKSAPLVPEQNPNRNELAGPDYGRLDLQPGPGDQYGARYAADQGGSAVQRPGTCGP